MDFEVAWAESAYTSLNEALEYVVRDSPIYAASLAIQAEKASASLRQLPHRGRRVPEYRDPDVREIPVGSYRLIYRVTAGVKIIAFVHSARDLAGLLDDA